MRKLRIKEQIMISLEEYAKVCSLIASCNDIIGGKFILAHNKIAALLKNLTASQEVYNLLATMLTNFDFEREFSRAKLKTAQENGGFAIPDAKEKLLPFVFCVLVNINNNTLDLDTFISEYFPSEDNDHSKEFRRFAEELILPFRDIIAQHFDIPLESVNTMKVQPLSQKENKEELKMKAEELEKAAELDEEYEYEDNEEEFEEEESYPEMTADRVEAFFEEITSNCEQILSELPYEKRLKDDIKDDAEYIIDTIIHNCEQGDLKNTIALITALDYVLAKSKNVKIYTREMKNVLIGLYENDEE